MYLQKKKLGSKVRWFGWPSERPPSIISLWKYGRPSYLGTICQSGYVVTEKGPCTFHVGKAQNSFNFELTLMYLIIQ
jgi:hypothetical protein